MGRLALSQNAKQRLVGNEYSYTDYDSLGRITEVGQITAGTALTDTISKSDSLLNAWFATNTTKRGQITQTVYDTAYGPLAGLELDQQNLRNRVSYTQFVDTATNLIPSSATYYSYDIHGNVDTLVQDFGYGQSGGVLNMMNTSGNRFKKTVYDYDLISGKVNQVSYQRNQPDAYYHRYDYDAENRITNVYSARDSVMLYLFQPLQEQEAQYEYYNHGPLMNTVLGKLQVQKQDYVYTLQGWLKGINPVMGGTLTNGKDTTDAYVYGRDVYGFSLHYYNKDYRAIGTASASTTVLNAMGSGATQLYNGNIAAMAVTLSPFGGAGLGTRIYNYKYDQLNRLVAMDAHKGLYPAAGTLGTFTDTLLKDYQERVSYDPNGNILTYNRHGDAARLSMDSMTYSYLDTSNKLDKVVDLAADNLSYNDIRTGQANGNYKYDAIGNMTADVKDTVSNITWTVYGKIASLVKSGNTIRYVYDASGNRILKQTHDDTTAYVRDATGNVLSVYTKQAGADTVVRAEADIYGSSRLGMATQHMAPDTLITTLQKNLGLGTKVIFTRGEKLFELDNHLGNVLATVSDRKIEIDSDANGVVDSYRADIISASDYYPFGMMMPSRNMHIGTDYRYGFNGKENDNEVNGEGNEQDYGMRIYDPRLGRFLSVDPLTRNYSMLTPYQFASDRPIDGIDLDGEEYTSGQLKQLKEQATTVLKNSSSDQGLIFVHGSANALANANSFGLSDNLPSWSGLSTDNLDEYKTPYEQQLYLWGRIFGDAGALVQSGDEVTGGLTTAAAGSETGVVGAVGLVVAGHGAAVGSAALYDVNWAASKLKDLGVIVQTSSDETSSTNETTNNQTNSAHGTEDASKSNKANSNETNPYFDRTKAQNTKSKKSFEKLIEEHENKLSDFKNNPDKYDNKGLLKGATKERREKIISGRVDKLNKQITKQKGELRKINEALKKQ